MRPHSPPLPDPDFHEGLDEPTLPWEGGTMVAVRDTWAGRASFRGHIHSPVSCLPEGRLASLLSTQRSSPTTTVGVPVLPWASGRGTHLPCLEGGGLARGALTGTSADGTQTGKQLTGGSPPSRHLRNDSQTACL